jgi:hypothetical protein
MPEFITDRLDAINQEVPHDPNNSLAYRFIQELAEIRQTGGVAGGKVPGQNHYAVCGHGFDFHVWRLCS